jgi:integrase
MAKSKRERYQNQLDKLDRADIPDTDKELIRENAFAHDPQKVSVTNPDRSTVSDSTLKQYVALMRQMAERADFWLHEATTEDVNRYMDGLLSGTLPGVKDEGLTAGTVNNHQGVARVFFEYHSHLDVDPGGIALISDNDKNAVDERDIFDKDDIHAIRTAATDPRDKALVDMLLYTGQRLSAILNLRLKDIDKDEGVFYLNEDAGDLKGASGKRSLFYAENAVRDWYNNHPLTEDGDATDPEAHFITHKYDWENKPYEPGERLDNSSIYRQLQRIGKRAGVDKPMNAHNFRHTFVTICKRNYGMDTDTIKSIIGHRPDSNIMETTYQHLTDDDIIDAAERDMGIQEEEPDSPLTPETCDVCGEVIEKERAKFCPSCGTAFTPDAKEKQSELQQDIGAAKALSGDDITDEELEAIAQDDALLAKLIEMRGDG